MACSVWELKGTELQKKKKKIALILKMEGGALNSGLISLTHSLDDATKGSYLSGIICQVCNKRSELTEDPQAMHRILPSRWQPAQGRGKGSAQGAVSVPCIPYLPQALPVPAPEPRV